MNIEKPAHGAGPSARRIAPEPAEAAPEPKKPIKEQIADWENEGGAAPEPEERGRTKSLLQTVRRRARLTAHNLECFVKERPLTALLTVFGLGLAIGGGARQLAKGRLLFAMIAKPLFVKTATTLLAKA